MHSVLVVDLDDTLIRTDLLYELIFRAVRRDPLNLFRIAFWTLKGKVHLKQKLFASAGGLDPSQLPYRSQVLEYIARERAQGVRTVLASASHRELVSKIARHLEVFDLSLGTSSTNLKGKGKLDALREYLGEDSFAYMGDSFADLPLWKSSAKAILVNPSPLSIQAIKRARLPSEVIRDTRPLWKVLFKQLRVAQWSKNVLIFVPLLAGHFYKDFSAWKSSLAAAVSFSLMASFVYVLNDLIDLEHDRVHPSKKNRPFASGYLSLRWGVLLLPLLFVSALFVGCALRTEYVTLLVFYALINLAYSLVLKRIAIVDVVVLAGMYTFRIYAGGVATGIPISHWLLSFSIFFFFGLAMAKRLTELNRTEGLGQGRGYSREDRPVVLTLGVTSQFLSLLVLAFYLNNEAGVKLYSHPERLWFTTPLLIYWNSRVWLLAGRDELHDDPVVFAMRDIPSWITAALFSVIFALAI